LALVPANRLRDGGSPTATVTENITLPTLGRHFSRGYLRRQQEAATVGRLTEQFDVRPRDARFVFGSLSGGNQQKVVLAKWLEAKPRVLLMHEPTHGVDVGAKRQILQVIQSAAADGTGCIIASSEYEELASVCDRVLVFRDGRMVAELTGADLTATRIGERALRGAQL
jgi:ribose transport system ATP-binding protein